MNQIAQLLLDFLGGTDFANSIMDSIVQWVYDQAMTVLDSIVFDFMGKFKPDIAYFNTLFPNATAYYETFLTIGIILVVSIFTLTMFFNLFGVVTGMEEKPVNVVIRTIIALFLTVYSGEIMNYLFKLGIGITDLVSGVGKNDNWAQGAYAQDGIFYQLNNVTSSVIKVLLTIIILWKILTLFIEIIERYLVMCLFWYLSPLANATFTTSATSRVFKSFYGSVFIQIIICALNMWFLRMTMDIALVEMSFGSGNTITDTLISGLIIIGWLEVAKKIDNYLRSMGLGVATTGGNLGRAVVGTVMTIAMAARTATRAVGTGGVSHGDTAMKDNYGKTHMTMGNKTVSNAAGLGGGVMSSAGQTVPNQDAHMSTDHRGKMAATIVGDAGKQVVQNSNIAGLKSGSVDMSTLTAGGAQGEQLRFQVATTDGDVVKGHVSRLAEENGVKGIESIGASGEKQYTYFDKGSGLPTGTGLEKGRTSSLHDANVATATKTVNGTIDVNSGAWNHTTMDALGFSSATADSNITLLEKGQLEISDAHGEKEGTILTSSHEGFDAAKGLGNYYQDPLTGNETVGFPNSYLGGVDLDPEGLTKYQGVRDIIGDDVIPKGTESLGVHGRQSYIRDMGNGRAMQYEIVTSDKLDFSKLNTYQKISLPNGGDVYCRSKVVTSSNNRGSGNGKRRR